MTHRFHNKHTWFHEDDVLLNRTSLLVTYRVHKFCATELIKEIGLTCFVSMAHSLCTSTTWRCRLNWLKRRFVSYNVCCLLYTFVYFLSSVESLLHQVLIKPKWKRMSPSRINYELHVVGKKLNINHRRRLKLWNILKLARPKSPKWWNLKVYDQLI